MKPLNKLFMIFILSVCLPSGVNAALTCFDDFDGDGYVSSACGGDDCDDLDPLRYPGNREICDIDNRDEDCATSTFGHTDDDRDGFVSTQCCNEMADGSLNCGTDCDDNRGSTSPIGNDVCNGLDDNCDGDIDEEASILQFVDADKDGHGTAAVNGVNLLKCPGTVGFSPLSNDCDDSNPAIQPGDMVCDPADSAAIKSCNSDGQWVYASCDTGSVCITQVNGTGVCVSKKIKKTH